MSEKWKLEGIKVYEPFQDHKSRNSNRISRVTREKHIRTVDENGEVKHEKNEQDVAYEREPDYIKLYIDGILLLTDLPKGLNDALQHLLQGMNYQNIVVLNSGIKRIIAADLGITTGRLNNIISQLSKKEIMQRIETGVYRFNPNIFGRGKWQDIKKIRMEVEFNPESKAEINSEFEYYGDDQEEENNRDMKKRA